MQLDPNIIINSLRQKLSDMTLESVMKDARIEQLEKEIASKDSPKE
ncbi:hypothetical protein ORN01_25035 [Bacillus cereus]|nr:MULTISPECIES: hypothetical protein [Bacillus cereus group]MDA1509656.1 hypothetical protein [Bacillus cereus group sp. TH36-2LC]MDZ4632223.1 hypothetical protein [Bacillus cereus]